jgi:hypothetical protein
VVDDEQEVVLDDEHDMLELNVLLLDLSVAFADASIGLTLKPSNFLTIAGVMHKFENDVVSIDILPMLIFSALFCAFFKFINKYIRYLV